MNKIFIIIAVTSPSYYPEETDIIIDILKNKKADYVHIRKPQWNLNELTVFINKIPSGYHKFLKLHDHFELLEKFQLGGVHLNSRNSKLPFEVLSVSKSAHSFVELEEAHDFDYVTLSPIFDSLSKSGYRSSFKIDDIRENLRNKKNIVALGGVTPDKIPLLKNVGFFGAAMLGHFFPPIINYNSINI